MNGIAIVCNGCGNTNVDFDPRTRMVTCHQCGGIQTYSRATLNKNQKVVYSKNNALSFFNEGKYENAYHYSLEVLNISIDNASALYMIAYYEEIVQYKIGALKEFFKKIMNQALEFEELEDLRNLFIASSFRLMDFEEDIIALLTENMKAEEDKKLLLDFFDRFCPYLISKRTSAQFLTERLVDLYKKLVSNIGAPKLCLSLIKSIESNPESPFASNGFFLKTKTMLFYNKFVEPVGEILLVMPEGELKTKLLAVYGKMKHQYQTEMEG